MLVELPLLNFSRSFKHMTKVSKFKTKIKNAPKLVLLQRSHLILRRRWPNSKPKLKKKVRKR